MAQGLEARTPFLDRDLIDFAQSIPASLKMRITDQQEGKTTEKWILRKACEDLLRDSNLGLIHREIECLNNRIGVPRGIRST